MVQVRGTYNNKITKSMKILKNKILDRKKINNNIVYTGWGEQCSSSLQRVYDIFL